MRNIAQALIFLALLLAVLFLAHVGGVVLLAISQLCICAAMFLGWYAPK